MAFKRSEANDLMVRCHRRCCICHRFCGVKMELHHIEQRAYTNDDSIENAIPVCFECHAEISLYNDAHPRGRKYHSEELQCHKEQWLRICQESPAVLLQPLRAEGVGPIQALLDELTFNHGVAGRSTARDVGALFLVNQFLRAISEGSFSLLPSDMQGWLGHVYEDMMRANRKIEMLKEFGRDGAWSLRGDMLHGVIGELADIKIQLDWRVLELAEFLSPDGEQTSIPDPGTASTAPDSPQPGPASAG
jgi:hypothetical protein